MGLKESVSSADGSEDALSPKESLSRARRSAMAWSTSTSAGTAKGPPGFAGSRFRAARDTSPAAPARAPATGIRARKRISGCTPRRCQAASPIAG